MRERWILAGAILAIALLIIVLVSAVDKVLGSRLVNMLMGMFASIR